MSASSGARHWRAPPHGFAPRASEVVGLCPCDWAVPRGCWTRVPSLPRQEGPCPLRSQAVTIPDRPHGEGTSASVCATPFLMDTEPRKGRQSSSGCRLGALWPAVPPNPDIQGTERTWRSREGRPGFGVAGLALGACRGRGCPQGPHPLRLPVPHLTVSLASGRPGWWGAVQVAKTGSSRELMEGGGERVPLRKGDAREMVSHARPLS